MITDAVFRALSAPLTFLLGLFPHITPPAWACTATSGTTCLPAKAAGLGQHLGAANRYVPLSEAFSLLEMAMAVVLAVLVFRSAVFVYGAVRGA